MELRRTASALLRSQTSPLSTFLSPSTSLRWQNTAQTVPRSFKSLWTGQSQRKITTTAINQSIRPAATTSASTSNSAEETSRQNSSADPLPETSSWVINQPRAGSQSRGRTGYSPTHNPTLTPERERAFNGGSSSADLLKAVNAQMTRPPTSSGGIDTARMLNPSNSHSGSTELLGMQAEILKSSRHARIPLRLNASTGRTVELSAVNMDFARGLKLLEMSCARNKVRADSNRQRFHERPGLKRKRLVRERWRRRFAEGFKGVVARVKELKRQGW